MVEFGKVAFDILHERGINFHVEFFGQGDLDLRAEYSHKNHGVLSPEQLGHLYRGCDIGVVFSATNYSLIPMEMMACGLPVVELDTESTRAIFPEDSVEYASPSPVAIADALELLIRNEERREIVRRGGHEFISALSWEKSAKALESAFLEGLSETCSPVVPSQIVSKVRDFEYKASVIIPTWNAGDRFHQVLNSVLDQKTDWPFEVLVLDSGSADGTVDFVRSKASQGVRLHEIPNDQFQHGRTRNLAISLTSGEFIGVLTQDALPADDRWLHNLVRAFEPSPLIAGVFGAHKAYPDASPYTTGDLRDHFEWHKRMPGVVDWYSTSKERPFGSVGWAQWVHYFSDNNAALRRSVWEAIPYPDIDWGEDQVWAWEVIKQGYKKAYANNATVFHSHNQTYDQTFKVSKLEGEFFLRYFSYSFERTSEEVCSCIRGVNARDYRRGRKHGWSDDDILQRMLENEASVRGHFAGRLARLEALNTTKFYRLTGGLPEPFVHREWDRATRLLAQAVSHATDLPTDFDALFYLLFNPDLLSFDCNPYDHYMSYGRHEAREFR
jgi:glycosyltransferase involved in cell wall biosynthesis